MDTPKLLIIDDDEALCESLIDILELEDYLVDTSHNAEDGIKKIEESFCNIVLLDMKLPDSDGIAVLEKIKEISPDTEVIIFTAYAEMDIVIKAMDRNAFSFLPKPYEIPYLITTIKRAREKQRITFENRILYEQTVNAEKEWEDTFDAISDLISVHDKDFNIIRCNKAVVKKLNVEYRDIIGKKCYEVFHNRNEPWSTCPFVRCKESLKPETEEKECMDGVFLMSCYPRFDETGKFNGVVHIARDITERKQVEEKVHMLSQAVEQSPATVIITDKGGNIEYVNQKFSKISGYDYSEVIGKNSRVLKSGEKPPEEYSELWKTITSGHEWRGEFHNKKKSGELYWEYASISPIRNQEGDITHFLADKEDITERKLSRRYWKARKNSEPLVPRLMKPSLCPTIKVLFHIGMKPLKGYSVILLKRQLGKDYMKQLFLRNIVKNI